MTATRPECQYRWLHLPDLKRVRRNYVAGLQFSFDLPYRGFLNVPHLAYKEIGHNALVQCGLVGARTFPSQPEMQDPVPTLC